MTDAQTNTNTKAKPCCWIMILSGNRICEVPAVGMVAAGPYCAEHIEKAAIGRVSKR